MGMTVSLRYALLIQSDLILIVLIIEGMVCFALINCMHWFTLLCFLFVLTISDPNLLVVASKLSCENHQLSQFQKPWCDQRDIQKLRNIFYSIIWKKSAIFPILLGKGKIFHLLTTCPTKSLHFKAINFYIFSKLKANCPSSIEIKKSKPTNIQKFHMNFFNIFIMLSENVYICASIFKKNAISFNIW